MRKPTRQVTLAVILILAAAWLMPVAAAADNGRAVVAYGAATSIQNSGAALSPQSSVEADSTIVIPLLDILIAQGPPPSSGGLGSDQGKGGGKGQTGDGNCPSPPCPKQ